MRLHTARTFRRRGISLLETIVASAILFITLAGIHSLLDTAGRHALAVKERTLATLAAREKLNEVASGALGMTSQAGEFSEDDDSALKGWEYSIETTQYEVTGLWKIVVKVMKPNSANETDAVTLESIVLDPSKRGSPLDEVKVATGGDTTSSDKSETQSIPSTTPMGGGTGGGTGGGRQRN